MLPATLRERFGVSLWEAGRAVSWGEMVALARAAIADTSTRLGAAYAGWSYPATQPELLIIAGLFGKDAKKLLPFDPAAVQAQAEQASQAEIDQAQAALEADIVLTS